MHETRNPSPLARALRAASLAALLVALHGCASLRTPPALSGSAGNEVAANRFPVREGVDVVGRVRTVTLESGDTLPDVARHFGLGLNAISAANPGVDVWVPEAGRRVILPMSFVLPDAPRRGIVVNLASMRLFQFQGNADAPVVTTYPVGVGTAERPTPTGQMAVARKAVRPTWHVPASIAADHRKKGDLLPKEVPPGPENPLGEYALYLSRAGYLLHGTNKPSSIGLNATNGCIRLYPENVALLYNDTPLNTPVTVVNQPYLAGQRDGALYLEAHAPGADAAESQRFLSRLKALEKKYGHELDWKKVEEVRAEARGIPVRVSSKGRGAEDDSEKPLEVEHPASLYGRPEVPELRLDAWYVLAADVRSEVDAQRLAAILNHQGPQIPARVVPKGKGYRVLAGPYGDVAGARDAARRLKLDLEIDGVVIEPVKKLAG